MTPPFPPLRVDILRAASREQRIVPETFTARKILRNANPFPRVNHTSFRTSEYAKQRFPLTTLSPGSKKRLHENN
jgi:hypothetical protein